MGGLSNGFGSNSIRMMIAAYRNLTANRNVQTALSHQVVYCIQQNNDVISMQDNARPHVAGVCFGIISEPIM